MLALFAFAACSGNDQAADVRDAGADLAVPDVSGISDVAAPDVSGTSGMDATRDDADQSPALPCTLGERRACTSSYNGCPSTQECSAYYNGYAPCYCEDCRFELGAESCSWLLTGEYLYVPTAEHPGNRVVTTGPDGGSLMLPFRTSEQECSNGAGWYAISEVGQLTITLCPASCTEHTASPEAIIWLDAATCPLT